MTGNEVLCKVYLRKLFFQNVLAFVNIFIDIITPVISSAHIACDIICVEHVAPIFLNSLQKKICFFL